jgi:cold shock protein
VRATAIRTGLVADFDDPRGLGTVVDADGGRFGFHCTAIVDGTRTIAVGTEVMFTTVAGHRGRMEATGIVAMKPALAVLAGVPLDDRPAPR